MRTVPEPVYDRRTKRLAVAYRRAIRKIQRELRALDVVDLSQANARAALAEVSRILAELNEESAEWVETNIPLAARQGVVRTIVALEVAADVKEAESIVRFNRLNREMVASAVADTQADLLAITQNVERRVRVAVRQATAEAMQANMAAGINGRRTISREVAEGIRKRLGDAADGAIIDRAGRRWRVETYSEMVARTKMMQTHMDASTNEALDRGVLYGRISSHGATDACSEYEGAIVRLTAEGDPRYPTVDELRDTKKIFHPNCKHIVSPVRRPERLRKED